MVEGKAEEAMNFYVAVLPGTKIVSCDSEDEIRRLSASLVEGGAELMPLNHYGFSRIVAWVNDRFGVSWQLSLE